MSINEQPTGYHFDVKGKLVKEHECPICLHLIRNATELPCSHLMCRDCLMYYEETELERDENANFVCSLCQEAYHRNQKKEFRSLDRIIRESLDVKCKNWKDNCDWVGNISGYQDHHVNVCEFLFVECSNNGCLEQMQRREIGNHKECCKYRMVSCEHCKGRFPVCWLEDHHEACPFFPVPCKNSECNDVVLRKQMEDHCKNECQHQLVACLFSQVGCNIQLPRHSMSKHHQEATEHHLCLLLKSHLDLSKTNKELEKQLKKSDEKMEEFEKSSIDLSKKNQDLEKQLNKSNDTIEQLHETVMKQEQSIENQHAEIAGLQNDIKQEEELVKILEKDAKKKLANLEIFAKQTADVLEMISKIKAYKQIVVMTLNQKDYDENDKVKEFKVQVKEKDDEKTDCYYLQVLGKAVKYYYNAYFPTTYGKRLKRMTRKMDSDKVYCLDNIMHMKTESCRSNQICFTVYNSHSLFQRVVNSDEKLNRLSSTLATYHDDTEHCYFVAFCSKKIKGVWLLHKTDEKQSIKLNINGRTFIEPNAYNPNCFFIFQSEE